MKVEKKETPKKKTFTRLENVTQVVADRGIVKGGKTVRTRVQKRRRLKPTPLRQAAEVAGNVQGREAKKNQQKQRRRQNTKGDRKNETDRKSGEEGAVQKVTGPKRERKGREEGGRPEREGAGSRPIQRKT